MSFLWVLDVERELTDAWVVARSHGSVCEGSQSWQIIARFSSEDQAQHYLSFFCGDDWQLSVLPEKLLL
mgnify:FL=1